MVCEGRKSSVKSCKWEGWLPSCRSLAGGTEEDQILRCNRTFPFSEMMRNEDNRTLLFSEIMKNEEERVVIRYVVGLCSGRRYENKVVSENRRQHRPCRLWWHMVSLRHRSGNHKTLTDRVWGTVVSL